MVLTGHMALAGHMGPLRRPHQEPVLPDEGQLLGPLAEAPLPQQDGTDATWLPQVCRLFPRSPPVTQLPDFGLVLVFVVRLIRAAQGIGVVVCTDGSIYSSASVRQVKCVPV